MRTDAHVTSSVTLAASQAAGFPVGGESLAVDLADTLVTVTQPATDLIVDAAAADRFWRLHAGVIPPGFATPSLAATRRLRDAIRRLLDAVQRGDDPGDEDVRLVNAAADAAPTTRTLEIDALGTRAVERWLAADPSDLPLAAAARSAIDLLADPAQRAGLRRCASPACSMLFVTGDARRRWCAPNICGNRDRAARHYRRHRTDRA